MGTDNNVILFDHDASAIGSNLYEHVAIAAHRPTTGGTNHYQNVCLSMGNIGSVNINQSVSFGSYDGYSNTANLTNMIELGGTTMPNVTSNAITLDSTITPIYCAVTSITSLSDERDKSNIQVLNNCSDIVEKIRPIMYETNMRDLNDGQILSSGDKRIGFSAQNLLTVEDESNYKGYLKLAVSDDPQRYYVNSSNVLPLLVQTLKELMVKNKKIKSIIDNI
jgi:hypothetical protein